MIDPFAIPSIPSVLADSDINGTVIWIVIVVGIAIVNYLRETFKKIGSEKPGDERDHSPEAEKVRRIIEEMKRGAQAAARPSRPAYPEPPSSSVPPLTRHVPSTPRKAASSQAPRGNTPVESSAQASLSGMTNAMASAEQSINSLSDAERRALQELKSGRAASRNRSLKPAAVSAVPASSLASGLRNREALRMAIIYREILGQPTALRKHAERPGF